MTFIPILIALGTVAKVLVQGREDLEIRGRMADYLSIAEIGQNSEKNLGDLKRLANTQTLVEDHQLMLMWKIFK